ncbi:MAG: deoxynucleoside kinase [Nitrospirota bacterium]|nr:deoxynucleoside kinase [Nitrospirota bacterium]
MLLILSGNIATGKTTLMKQLVQNYPEFIIHTEKPESNPYIGLIDANDNALLGFELHYLVSCVQAYNSYKNDSGITCIERSLDENAMFARQTLKNYDKKLYDELFGIISNKIECSPDGFIFLRASIETIHRNMSRRKSPQTDTKKIQDYPIVFQPFYEALLVKFEKKRNVIVIDMDKYDIVKSAFDKKEVLNTVVNFIESLMNGIKNDR